MVSTAGTALLVAILSAGLAATSLIWQIIAFTRSGQKVSCSLQMGHISAEELPSGGTGRAQIILSAKAWAQAEEFQRPAEQHFFVEVTNAGRAGVWVDSIGMTSGPDTEEVSMDPSVNGPKLPCRLDASQTERWAVPVSRYKLLWKLNTDDTACLHGSVRLGNGQTLTTPEGVRLGLLRRLEEDVDLT